MQNISEISFQPLSFHVECIIWKTHSVNEVTSHQWEMWSHFWGLDLPGKSENKAYATITRWLLKKFQLCVKKIHSTVLPMAPWNSKKRRKRWPPPLLSSHWWGCWTSMGFGNHTGDSQMPSKETGLVPKCKTTREEIWKLRLRNVSHLKSHPYPGNSDSRHVI